MKNSENHSKSGNLITTIKRVYKNILNPILQNPIFFIFQVLIINAPIWVYWITQYQPYLRLYTILATPITLFLAYTLTIALYFVPKSKVYLYALSYVFSLIEIYVIINFGTRFTSLIIQLIAETNTNETYEFVSSYILTRKFLFFCFFATMFIGINACVEKFEEKVIYICKQKLHIPHIISFLSVSMLLLLGTISLYRDIRFLKCIFSNNHTEAIPMLTNYIYGDNYTSFGKIFFSLYLYSTTLTESDKIAENLKSISNITSNFSSKNIVLILGESFNKYHSSLYGYDQKTNPLLESKLNNLFLFTDAITPHISTSYCLRKLFSFANQDSQIYWIDTPLFPVFFKSAGYSVTFMSNQECPKKNDSMWDAINNFLVHQSTIPYLFDYVNSVKHQFDLTLVDEFKNNYHRIHTQNYKLTIFHLLGQHVAYNERYPESDTFFTKNDYQHRKDLNDKQKEIIAHYDNATLYNDKVVASIIDIFSNEDAIVIYLSDHSDEVYDYRDQFGRSHETFITKGRAQFLYEVPFMIWVSDKYKEAHPDIIKRIENSVNRPFMTDDLPHLMLDLAGIECEWFEPSRSLINDQYNVNRKRLLEDSKQDYDEIMKSATLN